MSEKKMPRFYNRKFLVDPLQIRFIGVAIIHFAIIVLIFTSTLFVPIVVRLQSGDIAEPHVQVAAHEFLVLHNRLWLPMVGALILIVLHNVLFTHRVAGPLYRFRPYLEKVGKGDLSKRIKFRKRDHLKKEAEIASDMVESLRMKIVGVERQFDQANQAWIDLKNSLGGEWTGEQRRRIDAMERQIEECRTRLSVFKTGEERPLSVESTPDTSVMEPV